VGFPSQFRRPPALTAHPEPEFIILHRNLRTNGEAATDSRNWRSRFYRHKLHFALAAEGTPVVNLDKLTYAANLNNLEQVATDERYSFVHGDIVDRRLVCDLLQQYQPRAIVHFAVT
jgi:hypothetical protein